MWTPPLRKLTPKTSAGFACVEFSESVLGITLLPWQRWLLIHALELLPDGTYRFRTVVLLVARQNGKSTLMQVLSLWRMFVDGAPLVIGTAQNLDVAEEQWEGAVEIIESIPELDAEKAQISRVNGKKFIRLTTGERYKVAAASRRGGRGLSGDLVLLDELREHQNWEAWGAVTKTTMARLMAQVWAASNAGDSESVVLGFLRLMAHLALGNPDELETNGFTLPADIEEEDGDSLGIFEWSAPPGCDVWDRDAWAQANPSLGYTITERAIASAARTDPEKVFRTEVLCQWVDTLIERILTADSWSKCHDPKSGPVGRVGFALAVSTDRAWSCFAVAGASGRGGVHLEVTSDESETYDYRPGTDWVVERAKALMSRWGGHVAIATGSPAASLIDDLEAAGVEVLPVPPGDHASACGSLYDAVTTQQAHHLGQPLLTVAVEGADRKFTGGGSWLWDPRSSKVDISPLVAVTLAKWAFEHLPPPSDPGFVDLSDYE